MRRTPKTSAGTVRMYLVEGSMRGPFPQWSRERSPRRLDHPVHAPAAQNCHSTLYERRGATFPIPDVRTRRGETLLHISVREID